MHQQRPAAVIDPVTRGEIDVLQRLGHIDHASGMHVDAGTPEQPAEDDQVSMKVGHARCSTDGRDSSLHS